MTTESRARARVLEIARKLGPSGLSQGTSGNVSERVEAGFVVTPSGLPYEELLPEDLVVVGLDGSVAEGQNEPSSEWRIHRDIYVARSDAGGIVHAHPPHATTVACLGRDLPAVHYMIAVAGGDSVKCARYATFGTERLSELVLGALVGRTACLMQSHGMVAIGRDAKSALATAREIEIVAGIYLRALAVGEPLVLSESEMAEVVLKFETYGKGERRS
jgi:L-fuculose-phosphate aldolase